ncbi:MAG TPA: hypothetical protein VK914_10635 [bacterium]|jgi:hypothetical protein|nr:hypothetical protein [bacterium]
MKKTLIAAAVAAVLGLGAGLRADDTVTLKDGSSLQGQVMEETDAQVVLMDHGVQRTLDRSLVAKVDFNTSPSSDAAPAGAAAAAGNNVPQAQPAANLAEGGDSVPPSGSVDASASVDEGGGEPPAPTQDQMDYANGVSDYYQVAPDQVWGFEQQGIPMEELPVVFYVARRAQCAPGLVVDMRMQGMSWAAICMHFGLGPGIFYWHDVFAVDLGGPYDGIYWGFRRHPHRFWRWNVIALSDADIINCVNLRFSTAYWHCAPYQVAQWRIGGHPWFWGGYSRGYFHRGGVHVRIGAGYGGHGGYGHVHGGYGHGHGGYGGGGYGGGGHEHNNGGGPSHDDHQWNHN